MSPKISGSEGPISLKNDKHDLDRLAADDARHLDEGHRRRCGRAYRDRPRPTRRSFAAELLGPPLQRPRRSAKLRCDVSASSPLACHSSIRFAQVARVARFISTSRRRHADLTGILSTSGGGRTIQAFRRTSDCDVLPCWSEPSACTCRDRDPRHAHHALDGTPRNLQRFATCVGSSVSHGMPKRHVVNG